MLTLPKTERAPRLGTLAAQRPAWAYYLRRRRRGFVPTQVAGLKLWLDAALGTFRLWEVAPASGNHWHDYSPSTGYTANGNTHYVRIYPFRTVAGTRVYSSQYLELQATDDSSTLFYLINWTWDAVPGAEGYRVLKLDPENGFNFDHFYDAVTESLVDTGPGIFTVGATVLPVDNTAAQPGDAVAEWRDQSGANNHATQATAAQRAILQSNVVNGRPVLRFDASDDGYATPLLLNTPCTVFAVYAFRDSTSAPRRAVQGSNNWLLGPYDLQHNFFNGSSFSDGPATVLGQFVVHASWQDGSQSRNWVNGSFVGSTLGAGIGPGTLGLGTAGGFLEPLDGDVAEVLVYDSALSLADMWAVWSYLAGKYHL